MSDSIADLEKVGAGAAAAELQANETTLLGKADTLMQEGETDAVNALAGAIKAHVPLIGGAVSGSLKAVGDDVEHAAEGALKALFDRLVADLQAKAA